MPRLVLESGSYGPEIVIHEKPSWFALLFTSVFAAIWGFALNDSPQSSPFPTLFRLHAVIVPLLIMGAVLFWLWSFLGRRIVRLEAGALMLRDELLFVGFSREFEAVSIRKLRERYKPASRNEIGAREYTVAFDYGAKTFTVARC